VDRRSSSLRRRLLALFLNRCVEVLPVLFGITLVTFLLVRLLPGGPIQTIVGIRASPAVIAAAEAQLGLSKPVLVQYFYYLEHLLRGDLGYSLISGASVDSIVSTHLGVTLALLAYAVVLALVIGIPLAVISAYRKDTWADHAIRAGVVCSLGLPSFWIGLLLIAYVGLRLRWFPSGGDGTGFVGFLYHLFLPALTLALTFLAVLVRSLRTSISDIMRAEFVDAARLKGISGLRILRRHVLRIAILPAVTLVGLNLAYLLGATVIVENVFDIPGMGQQLVEAILERDFIVVQGITLIFGFLVLVVSLAVDLVQVALDPRIG
jgi:peptide/nickel transport system permease protein